MYADSVTESMEKAITETERRNIQTEYNKKHGITPRTIIKPISDVIGISQIVNDYGSDGSFRKEIQEAFISRTQSGNRETYRGNESGV